MQTKFTILILFVFLNISAQDNSQEIIDFLNRKDWKNAEKALSTAIEQYPEKEWLYTSQIWAKQNLEKYQEAIEVGRAANRKWPESEKVKEALANILSAYAGKFLEKQNPKEGLPLIKEAYGLAKLAHIYIWYGIALKQSEDFENAISIFEEGLKKFPANQTLARNYAYTLSQSAQNLQTNGKWKESQPLLEKAYELEKKDSFLFLLAVSYREQGDFLKAISLLEEGVKKYPSYTQFQESLPYTRYIHFKEIINSASIAKLRSEVDKTISYLNPKKLLKDQFYYKQLISVGLRKINDIKYLEKTYLRLISLFPKEPEVYDRYGFEYYANLRLKSTATNEDKKKAIELRRKGMAMYESLHPNRKEILDTEFPVRGRYVVTSQFKGTAMTHNGFANYCYDFIAVNESGESKKPKTTGKKNEDFFNFNQPIYAIEDGVVEDLLATEIDNEPGDYTYSANYISVNHGTYTAFYAHLKQNSIRVKVGDKIKKGAVLGNVGNSGMSTESHLHFCLNDENWVSIPFRFKEALVFSEKNSRNTTDPYLEGEIVEFK